MNASAMSFICDVARRIRMKSNDEREADFLFQRLAITIQRYNAVLLHDSFGAFNDPDK